jgi:flagella basal body P-ring formation protein FlgA
MVYRSSNIEISTLGSAMESGSMGDVIKVKNSKSNMVVTGTIVGSNLVKIMGLQQ